MIASRHEGHCRSRAWRPRGAEARRCPRSEAGSRSGGRSPARGRRESRRRLHPQRRVRAQAPAAVHSGIGRRRRNRSGRRERQERTPSAIACSSTARPPNTRTATTAAPTRSARSAVSTTSTACRRRFRSGRARRWACRTRRRIARCSIAPATQPGETVLVHGATGGVGLAAVQIAHAHGITVIGTGGTDKGLQPVRENGADSVFNHTTPGYLDDDHAGDRRPRRRRRSSKWPRTSTSTRISACSRTRGRIVVIGNRGRVEIDARQAMGKDATILGMTLFNISDPDMASINAYMVAGLANGTLKPVVGREFPLADAAQGAGRRDGGRRARKNRPRSLKQSRESWPKPSTGRRGVRSGAAAGSSLVAAARRPHPERRHDAVVLRRRALVRLARLRRRLLEDAEPAEPRCSRRLRSSPSSCSTDRSSRLKPANLGDLGVGRHDHHQRPAGELAGRTGAAADRARRRARSSRVVTGFGMMAEWPTLALYWYGRDAAAGGSRRSDLRPAAHLLPVHAAGAGPASPAG